MKWLKPLTNLFKKKDNAPPPEIQKVEEAKAEVIVANVKKTMSHNELSDMRKKPRTDLPANWKTHRITVEQKHFIVDCIAKYLSDQEVVDALKETYGVDMSLSNVWNYRKAKKWAEAIDKRREKYLTDLHATPGFHKKVRMDRKEQIYHEAKRTGKIKDALAALDSQRAELEEKGNGSPVSFVFQQYNNLSDEELNERYERALEKVKKHQGIIDVQKENKNGNG